LEAWERVLVDAEKVTAGVHAYISCTHCHGGSDVEDMELAHEGIIRDPSEPPSSVCGDCHVDAQAAYENSLHLTLAGYDTVLHARSTPDDHPTLEEMEANHCNNCHASCGQCHISQPTSVGGGLLEGHEFVSRPPMSRTCTACHGSRVKDEYTGANEGYPADIHFTLGGMNCVDCHTGDEMHGVGMEGIADRYDGARVPTCESCHADVLTADAGIQQHTIHGQDVACQVCHSVSYKNCSNCHVQQTEDGVPYYEIDPSWMEFRIGLNTERTLDRPWQYVLVRHVPISPTSFEFYGEDLLSNFDARATWVEATPHNIQRLTPQATRCENCHGNPDIFLTVDAVLPEELEANRSVIVSEPPSLDLIESAGTP
jgi:thiosulfate/3-mercaptopyruvate sulfurtransferase